MLMETSYQWYQKAQENMKDNKSSMREVPKLAPSWELWHLYTMESRSEEDITMVRLYLEELGELLGISAPAVLDLHEFCTSDDADVWELAMVTIERMDDPLGYV